MNADLNNGYERNILIEAIHTAVKGRARYKVSGLKHSQSLKNYLVSRLSQEKIIGQFQVNNLTGNVLVIFNRDLSPNAIALILQNIVLDYTKKFNKLLIPKLDISEKAKNLPIYTVNNHLIELSGAIFSLALCSALLHRYGLDRSILLAIQKLHTPLLDRVIVGITFFGEPLVLLLISLGVEINLLYDDRRWQATTLGIATSGAMVLMALLKLLFGRARPTLWKWIINVGHPSFPSGHAMLSLVVYGLIAYLFAKQYPQWQKQIFTLTAILILAIGFSRLYLGVHWPTDVFVGYAVGLLCLATCIITLQLEQKYLASR
ncbi:Phosphatidic acid phosphatase type 2/haloperoxidase domain-containing protein [Nostoc sp. DSM 114161]|jgi:membrane-associated phospholipid phosphatase|uniref:phosphatase PAP2 family protein n=1 Tax=Nostoc sp. DSM 114161 TaxID=3440143 RepID=UPI004045C522